MNTVDWSTGTRITLADLPNLYDYTTEPIAATRIDDGHFEVVQHLDGNFPGGTVDLRYRFTLTDELHEVPEPHARARTPAAPRRTLPQLQAQPCAGHAMPTSPLAHP